MMLQNNLMSRRSIAILASHSGSLVNFRGPLIADLVRDGHRVHALGPDEGSILAARIAELGATFHSVPLARAKLDPWSDIRFSRRVERILRAQRIDTILAYTIKPVVFGIPAAARAGATTRVALITGLGYTFGKESIRQRATGAVASILYRHALRRASAVRFQNPDDLQEFVHLGLVDPSRTGVVAGSGVDLLWFRAFDPRAAPPVRFLLIARLISEKGIRDYVEAAHRIKAIRQDCEFHLVGAFDPGPAGLPEAEVAGWAHAGVITLHPATDDVRPHLRDAHVFVLPSFYREGTPRTILEAMAVGRPIITTNSVGCRETTIDGDNGFLVPVKSPEALAYAMQVLADDPDLRLRMGRRSRELAEEKYDVRLVNRDMMKAMELLT